MQDKSLLSQEADRVGQMTWKPDGAIESGILHLRYSDEDIWQPYTDFPDRALEDPEGCSQGYATFLSLLKQKWQIL
jgi:hypothetical protein